MENTVHRRSETKNYTQTIENYLYKQDLEEQRSLITVSTKNRDEEAKGLRFSFSLYLLLLLRTKDLQNTRSVVPSTEYTHGKSFPHLNLSRFTSRSSQGESLKTRTTPRVLTELRERHPPLDTMRRNKTYILSWQEVYTVSLTRVFFRSTCLIEKGFLIPPRLQMWRVI